MLEATRWHARAAAWAGYNDPARALRHWRKVRELADALPESPETVALGLEARSSSLNYGWRLGISHDDAKSLFDQAERMAAKSGDVRSRAILLDVYGSVRGSSEGDVRGYAKLARQAIDLAERSGDPALYVSIAPSAYALFCTGEYRGAVAVFDRAIELAAGDPAIGSGIIVGCPFAYCHTLKGLNLLALGELDEARSALERGREMAGVRGDSEVVGWSLMFSTWLAFFDGDAEAARGRAQQALEIAERIGDSFSRAHAWFFVGLSEVMREEWRGAIEALERSLAIARERRTSIEGDPLRLAALGESHSRLGDVERGRALVEQGIELARRSGSPFNDAYASLSLARILGGSGGVTRGAQIRAALSHVLDVTRGTGALAFEPLVHVELAELARQNQDTDEQARELREAHRLFSLIGAHGHADRLSAELAGVG
jgi:tetratricopeptide (TPR) repeat protein